MSKLLIKGGNRIAGTVKIHGAKNSVLPILAATLLCDSATLHNCPNLSDVAAAEKILGHLGSTITHDGYSISIDNSNIHYSSPPDELMGEMRSSILFLGAILTRFKKAKIGFPGGCELGARPIDLHISGLRKLGAIIEECHGYLDCEIKDRLVGNTITLSFPSVGATENLLLAAVTAKGTTYIHNAAREPEIIDLANFLNKAGGKISINRDVITIVGVEKLYSVTHSVIPDRIEAATLLSCAAVTGGEILLTDVECSHMVAILPIFEEMGCAVKTGDKTIFLSAPPRLNAVSNIKTMPYPGFPTDAQSPIMAALTVANGSSVVVENIFDSRFKQVSELRRLGADIQTEGHVAIIKGVKSLYSAKVNCTDLRGGAALVVAAVKAVGTTEIGCIYHLDRGYCELENSLSSLGVIIERNAE